MIGKNIALIILLCFSAQIDAFSQNRDTLTASPDTGRTAIKPATVFKDSARLALESMPRKAAIKSAILPGLGQIYNKRWWKVPLVYGGFVALGFVYEYNQRYYKIFLKEAQYRELNPGKTEDPRFATLSDQGIITIKDEYRRDRDLTILGSLGFYAINIIDAYIDAKFFRFDISDELSFKVGPFIHQGEYINASAERPALGIKLNLAL